MVGVHSSIFGNVRDRRPIQGRATEQTALTVISTERKEPRNTMQCASPFSQRTRKKISTLSSRISGNVIRARYSSTILIKTLQWPRIRLIDAMKMMGCSTRGWG